MIPKRLNRCLPTTEPAVPKIPRNCKNKNSKANSVMKLLMLISGIYYFRCWLALVACQSCQETHWKRTLASRTKTIKGIHQRTFISPVSIQIMGIWKDNAKSFCFVTPKLEVTAFTCCLQNITSLFILGAKGSHKHSFWHKPEVFKNQIFLQGQVQ